MEGIPSHYAEKFNALGEQIRLFREDFDQYVKKKGVELTEIVRELEEKLKAAEEIVKAYVLSNIVWRSLLIPSMIDFFTLDAIKQYVVSARYQLVIILTPSQIRDVAKYVEFIPIVGVRIVITVALQVTDLIFFFQYFAEQVTELFVPGTTKKRRGEFSSSRIS